MKLVGTVHHQVFSYEFIRNALFSSETIEVRERRQMKTDGVVCVATRSFGVQ